MPNGNRFGLGCCCSGLPPTCSVRLSFIQPCSGVGEYRSRMIAKLFDLTTGLQVGATADSNAGSIQFYPNLVDGRPYKFTVTFGNSATASFVSPLDFPFTADCAGPTMTIPVTPTLASYVYQVTISLMKAGAPTEGVLDFTYGSSPQSWTGLSLTNIFQPFLTVPGPATSGTLTLHLDVLYDVTGLGPPLTFGSEYHGDITVSLDYCDSFVDPTAHTYVVDLP